MTHTIGAVALALLLGAAAGTARGSVADPQLAALLPGNPPAAAGVPAESEVLFSPRFDRPEVFDAVRGFGATRLVWSYVPPGTTQMRLRAHVGGRFGGTLNNNAALAGDRGAALDFEGRPIVAPWMKSWGAIWNSCARPAAMQALKDSIERQASAGIAQMQFDDAGMQFDSAFWSVGDLSPENLQGFGRWLQQRAERGERLPLTPMQGADYREHLRAEHGVRDTEDYVRRSARFPSTPLWREYLLETVDGCLAQVRAWLREAAGPEVPLSVNLYTPYPWAHNRFQLRHADYVLGELNPRQSQPHQLLLMSQWLRREGKRWAAVLRATETDALRRSVARLYAAGALPVVPWDTFVPGTGSSAPTRHFSTPAQLGDLYAFVRQRSALFDGWELLSRATVLVPVDPVRPDTVLEELERLSDAHVPYAVALLPAGAPARPPAPGGLVWQAGAARAPTGANATPPGAPTLGLQSAAALASQAVARAVSPGWRVWVKGHPQQAGRRVVHLLPDGATADTAVRLTLASWALPPGPRLELRQHQPGVDSLPPRAVDVQADGSLTVELTLKRPGEWLVLELGPVTP